MLFLPDPVNGYYRSSRFDWAGVIGCVSYKGHTFFGEWFADYDPMLHDAITGPVEEFRGVDGEIGYDRASAGGSFLKIGVGVLRRIDASPYRFATVYPILNTGTRSVHISKRSITFTQRLTTDFNYAYLYTKTIKLDKHGAVLTIDHKLKNIGSQTLASDVYEHDFFMLDNKIAGPGIVVKLGFTPVVQKPLSDVVRIVGNDIVYMKTPDRGNSPQGYLTGYTGKPGEYSITLEDRNSHVAVEQTSASPIATMFFWSTPKTICPEAYIHLNVAPGKTQTWQIAYRFKAD